MNMKCEAVIFDLDGTLLDTLQDLTDAVNGVLRRSGFPEHGLEAYRYFVGDGMEDLARRALPEKYRDEATVTGFVTAIMEEYGQRWPDHTGPFEGIPELLDALTARRIRMAILTNKPDDSTRVMVSKLLPRWQFHIILGATPSLPKKPDPQGASQIADYLNLPSQAFLYVGDSDIDMKTASAAGMYAVGVLWGFRTADELIRSGAKVLIDRPLELLELL